MLGDLSKRSRADRALLWASVAAVFVASFFSRKAGACGTAHWLFFRLTGGLISELISDFFGVDLGPLIDTPAAILLNAGVFVFLMRVWNRKAPARWFAAGVVLWTVLYLLSYFYFFPTRDCP